jgi:hypothetical protein
VGKKLQTKTPQSGGSSHQESSGLTSITNHSAPENKATNLGCASPMHFACQMKARAHANVCGGKVMFLLK